MDLWPMNSIRSLGKATGFVLRRRGFVGGVWLLWDDSNIKDVMIDINRAFIHAEVTLKSEVR